MLPPTRWPELLTPYNNPLSKSSASLFSWLPFFSLSFAATFEEQSPRAFLSLLPCLPTGKNKPAFWNVLTAVTRSQGCFTSQKTTQQEWRFSSITGLAFKLTRDKENTVWVSEIQFYIKRNLRSWYMVSLASFWSKLMAQIEMWCRKSKLEQSIKWAEDIIL